jgi:hypothetical protein
MPFLSSLPQWLSQPFPLPLKSVQALALRRFQADPKSKQGSLTTDETGPSFRIYLKL